MERLPRQINAISETWVEKQTDNLVREKTEPEYLAEIS
jgi:hypothetical protein